jgi:hypothetical protein
MTQADMICEVSLGLTTRGLFTLHISSLCQSENIIRGLLRSYDCNDTHVCSSEFLGLLWSFGMDTYQT